MEESKRKQLETRLRQLINAANQESKKQGPISPREPGSIQVIRRRKGRPDRHIVQNQTSFDPATSSVG